MDKSEVKQDLAAAIKLLERAEVLMQESFSARAEGKKRLNLVLRKLMDVYDLPEDKPITLVASGAIVEVEEPIEWDGENECPSFTVKPISLDF